MHQGWIDSVLLYLTTFQGAHPQLGPELVA
jgi:hypothetical protein